jgi:hypothetical protein
VKSEVYDNLKAAIEAVESALQCWRIPASVSLGTLGTLEYGKSSTGYRLFWYPPNDPNGVLLTDAPLKIRTAAAHELPALLDALERADEQAERKAVISIYLYNAFAARLGRTK